MTTYTPIVGMEIHVELGTSSKMFCGCKNDPFFAAKPNIHTCPVCLGMPGGLPVPNKRAVEWTVLLGLALGCDISAVSKFDRKNYFYPDLAKGYQISQYDQPLCTNGGVHTAMGDVRIRRVHLEEDTGKLMHTTIEGKRVSLIDFNRSGVPLVEIVTEPDIRSSDHAREFLKKLHQIVRYLGISSADLEKGSMRLEPNISLMKGVAPQGADLKPEDLPAYKVEVKNINSFSFVKKAIDYEVVRQSAILETGKLPVQETRGFVESKNETVSQRIKEEAADYRYFPDPDIPPLVLGESFVEERRGELPELPDAKIERFVSAYGIPAYDATILAETRQRADFYEAAIGILKSGDEYKSLTAKQVANVIINKKPDIGKITPKELVSDLVRERTENEISDDAVEKAVGSVIVAQAKAVADFRSGKTGVLMFLVGQVKKELKGKGDPQRIANLLTEAIARGTS